MVIRILILTLALSLAVPALAQEDMTVVYGDGRSTEVVDSWKVEPGSDAIYLRAHDVARIFKATQFWNASSRKVVLGVGNTRFTLSVDTRVVVVDGEPVMLQSPVRYSDGFIMIPLEFVMEVASPFTPVSMEWDAVSRTLSVQQLGYNVQSIAFSSAKDRSSATITLTEPLIHHVDSSTPGLVRLKLYGGRIDAGRFLVRKSHGLFNSARAEQTERDAFVYFDIKRETTRILVERKTDPARLVLNLEKGELPEIPDPEFADRREIEVVDNLTKERRQIRVQTIVLDPGHGGKDHGKTGVRGVIEKEVNLEIAMKAREAIERELGLDVVLTREDDRLLSLIRRTEIANESGADLFISIHCNSWFSAETGGFEAYFLSPARTDMDRAVELAENQGVTFDANTEIRSDINFILWDMVQNEFINESSNLAELMQKSMNDRLKIRNRGVKQANFVVLQGARMPAVLIEAGFLSNPNEEEMLMDPTYQRDVADGIVEAIRRFRDRYQR